MPFFLHQGIVVPPAQNPFPLRGFAGFFPEGFDQVFHSGHRAQGRTLQIDHAKCVYSIHGKMVVGFIQPRNQGLSRQINYPRRRAGHLLDECFFAHGDDVVPHRGHGFGRGLLFLQGQDGPVYINCVWKKALPGGPCICFLFCHPFPPFCSRWVEQRPLF